MLTILMLDHLHTTFSALGISLGVHSLSPERETSTGVLANIGREFANLKRKLAELERFSRF